jgi:hypothetical protein
MTVTQSDKAKQFRALHEAPEAFVVANVWDGGSARMMAGLGFAALATSSGASAGVLHESPVLLATPNRSGLGPSFPAWPICCSAFRPWSASLALPTAWPTMPSADSCVAVRSPRGSLSSEFGTRHRPPQVSSIAFPAPLPDLQPWPLMDMDFATSCPLVRPVAASYPVAVRQVAISLHVSFRRSLAVPPSRSLVLHLHQVAQGTFTPRLLDMPSTQTASRRFRRWPSASLDRHCARRAAKLQAGTEKRHSSRTEKL